MLVVNPMQKAATPRYAPSFLKRHKRQVAPSDKMALASIKIPT
ncbi:MAG: hypothetical protein QW146_05960 [Candidatus Bathyarchaeia archaeon]